MPRLSVLVGLAAAIVTASSSPAWGYTVDDAGLSSSPFAVAPVADEQLAVIVGAGLTMAPLEHLRAQTDRQSVEIIQQAGQTSRIEMDNWWAQTGASLIDANIIAARPGT